ncbi:FtsX-like permease family protein [Streptomyces rapamycinicus]|uniref:ABC transporter permease n=3 Tax=Streptomyces rapamycinicus TaxID=1226757 RepID=A0A3L8RKY6_STRRN|nr:FtsX-like permease family protein [Streptomyces rapamycinicus]RLV80200.1 ABC transporter permease [Streptomyces rapamycinicus NRRL 5491]UTO64637.1 FtsX-like permease family protein [Streptomyces rapamycinicus]UTP32593.1 FtsX-like permease family protein [Streptomyces rapamycinicus NRRL 5491]
MKVAALLAARATRAHRKAWIAVFAALALTSLLLGAFGLTLVSAWSAHPRVERYAAADLVVAGDQTTRFSATSLGERETASAGLTERVRIPRTALSAVRGVPGVRTAVPDVEFPVGLADRSATGHPWETARLAPYALRTGRAPERADEVVVGAGAGRPGGRLTLRVGGRDAAYTVVGVADGPRTAVWFTGAEARRLSGNPEALDAIGVVARPGTDRAELAGRVRKALDTAGVTDVGHRADGDPAAVRVLTGSERGEAEFLAAAPARGELLAALGSVAGAVVLVALLVVSSTIVQALRQRSHELGLLRAVGATPWQLRGAVGREVGRVAAWAALVGAAGAVPAYLGLRALLAARGALPTGLELTLPPLLWPAPLVTAAVTVLVAGTAALVGCSRTAAARPAEVLRERAPGRARGITGLVLLGVGASSAGTAALQQGATAAAAAGAAAVTMVIACAVLGPWIAEGAMRLLGAPLRLFGPGGRLAAANCAASAHRLGAAITPIVLVTAFAAVQLSGGATMTHAGDAQARQVLRADLAVRADGGLTAGAVERIRELPGVRAATEAVPGTVLLARSQLGSPELERLPVFGVTPERLTRTLDPGVRNGDLARLRPGTIAVGADRADALGARPGSTVTLRFGDGQEARLRVVATYERAIALGDFLLSRDELLRHTSMPDAGRILVATAPDADRKVLTKALARAVPGARVERDPAPVRGEAAGQALAEVVSVAVVAAIGAFTVIAVLSTLALIATGRRPELRLLRLAGAGRRQLRRMLRLEAAATVVTGLVVGAAVASVPLLAFSAATAGTLPYLPPVQAVAIVSVVVTTAAAGSLPPVWPTLRGRYVPSPSGD